MAILKKITLLLWLILGVLKTFSGSFCEITYQERMDTYNTFKKQEQINKEIRRRLIIIESISYIESSHNPNAYNKKEKAIGVLQIRPIMVKEVNLYTNYKLSHEDCWDKEKSIEAFIAFQNKFNPQWDAERAAKLWNGGRKGYNKQSTEKYWKKVKKRLEYLQFETI